MSQQPRFGTLGRILSLLFFLGGVVWIGDEIAFQVRSAAATGMVVEFQKDRHGTGKAVIEFTVNDETCKATTRTTFYFEPKPGDSAKIRYRPVQKGNMRIDEFSQRYLMAAVCFAIALGWNAGELFRRARSSRPEVPRTE